MEKISDKKPSGLSGNMLRFWGILFLLGGIISRGILQTRLLGVGALSSKQLLELMQADPNAMAIATAALVLQALESCAAPIFAFLLVEGFTHTKDWTKYALRVAGVAALGELPYNLVVSGNLLHTASRNPVFGLLLGFVVLYFCRRYEEKSGQNTAIKLCVIVAAMLWAWMLNIEHGILLVLLVSVLWTMRKKSTMRALAGAGAGMACVLISPFYLASSMGFLPVHLYNDEQGNGSRWVNYLVYPVLLLLVGVLGLFL